MSIRDAFLPEFDHEMGTTRKTLERVPENNTDWKPHDKSMTMGRLAGHLVELSHAPRFWRIVREICPEMDRAKAWLDAHGADLHRYGSNGQG